MTSRTAMLAVIVSALACDAEAPRPPAAAPSAEACEAQQVLDGIDARAPVPLLPPMAAHQKENMRDHLLAVQEIVAGAAAADFDGVERAAKRIGLSDEMHRTCSHMGQGAPGFTEQALQFHGTAEAIGEAARVKDRDGVLRALGATLAKCNGCHASYRQEVVATLPSPEH